MRGATSPLPPSSIPSQSFNPRAPCGARRCPKAIHSCVAFVSIHAPRAGRDAESPQCAGEPLCFNPRAPCGARPLNRQDANALRCFNPRAPCGARRKRRVFGSSRKRFQSTRPVRGATVIGGLRSRFVRVSIHAPRAGRDLHIRGHGREIGVSIHAPRAGRDPLSQKIRRVRRSFNPRAPCGARPYFCALKNIYISFNPRAPCGARPP